MIVCLSDLELFNNVIYPQLSGKEGRGMYACNDAGILRCTAASDGFISGLYVNLILWEE